MESHSASVQSQPANRKQFKKAIVMGGGMAGLWTARALSDHFDEVLVLERDQLPDNLVHRPGVPQARQYHVLLQSGLERMKAWFPGLEEELIAAGAVPFDVIGDVRIHARGRWHPQFPSGSILLSCSRILLESSVRRRVRQNPCIRFIEGTEIVGLQGDPEKRRVTGVRFRNRRAGSAYREENPVLTADLVVDALGRGSSTPKWLAEMGYPFPEESEVDSFLGYVTRRYARKPDTPILWVMATPPHAPYGALLFPEENDAMVVLVSGFNKRYPPTDAEEFEVFLPVFGLEFQEALEGAEPISQPYGYRGTSSRWRHYEKMESWPERFVVLGDAFCAFNPIYGQGMSAAAMSAAALAEQVRHSRGNLDGVAKSTLREISKITQGIWLLATSADLAWPETEGGTVSNGAVDRFGRWYVDQVLDATVDKKVRLALIAVNQLVRPASSLFAPGIFLRVMKHALLRKRQEK